MKKLGFVICTLSAAASVGLGYAYLQRLEADVSGGPRIGVIVAAEDIPVAAKLTEKLLAVRDIPRAYVESRHVRASELQKVLGQRVIEGLKANDALMASDVAKFSERKSLSGLVANGMRAISIDGRAADFDGLLRPGDHVDVLLSLGGLGDSDGATMTLLQNLLVLSVGGTTERDDENKKSFSRGATVTLSVSLEQAQVLTEAMRRGKLTLTLRNADDITLVEGVGEIGVKDLGPRNNAAQKPVVAAAAPQAPAQAVVSPAPIQGGPSHVR